MRFSFYFSSFFLLLNISSAATFPEFTDSCSEPTSGSCDYYPNCVEAKVRCGDQGYALGYGGKYCRRFSEETRFSPEGAIWRNNTRLCLQKSLASLMENQSIPTISCERIMDFAFDSHPDCYTRPASSICRLSFSDVYLIFNLIENYDKISPRGLKQIRSITHKCLFDLKNQKKNLSSLCTRSRHSSSTQTYFDGLQVELDEKILFWQNLAEIYSH